MLQNHPLLHPPARYAYQNPADSPLLPHIHTLAFSPPLSRPYAIFHLILSIVSNCHENRPSENAADSFKGKLCSSN